jgi:hypothetical protein
MVDYEILRLPTLAQNLAASATKRVQAKVPEDFALMVSDAIADGDWGHIDPESGERVNAKGQTLVEFFEAERAKRPFWDMPAVLEDEAEAAWTSGNMTKHGERWKQLRKFHGSDKLADVAFAEEAKDWSVKPYTTQIGTKPGEKSKAPTDQANLSSNPWSDRWRGDETARAARIASVLKAGIGKKPEDSLAGKLAKAAGTTIGKPLPLRK